MKRSSASFSLGEALYLYSKERGKEEQAYAFLQSLTQALEEEPLLLSYLAGAAVYFPILSSLALQGGYYPSFPFFLPQSFIYPSPAYPFFAFSPLLPEAAASVGYNTMALVVPVQLAASLARPMSPISGVIIAVSGIAGLTPIELIRRTIPVMILGMVVNVIAAQIFL